MADIVNGLLLRNGEVLLVRRSPHRTSYPDRWSFPGGHVEVGESAEEALVRELGEELAIAPTAWSFMSTIEDRPPGSEHTNRFYMFKVTDWQGKPALCGTEHTEMRWLDPSAAAMMPDHALPHYRGLLRALCG